MVFHLYSKDIEHQKFAFHWAMKDNISLLYLFDIGVNEYHVNTVVLYRSLKDIWTIDTDCNELGNYDLTNVTEAYCTNKVAYYRDLKDSLVFSNSIGTEVKELEKYKSSQEIAEYPMKNVRLYTPLRDIQYIDIGCNGIGNYTSTTDIEAYRTKNVTLWRALKDGLAFLNWNETRVTEFGMDKLPHEIKKHSTQKFVLYPLLKDIPSIATNKTRVLFIFARHSVNFEYD